MTSPQDPEDAADPADRGAAPPARGLRVVSFQAGRPGSPEAEPNLLREYKGPTVARVVKGAAADPPLLPGRICTVLEAIQRGDLASADRRLDAAVNVLPGPGFSRRGAWSLLWPWFGLWVLALIATGAAVLWW